MNSKQTAVFAGLAALIVAGQFAIQKHFENARREAIDHGTVTLSAADADPSFAAIADTGAEDESSTDIPAQSIEKLLTQTDLADIAESDDAQGVVRITDRVEAFPSNPFEQVAAEADISEEEGVAIVKAGPELNAEPVPGQLPSTADASPLANGRQERDAIIRKIIEKELPDASEEDRQIWFEEMRSWPPQMASELLAVRRRIGYPLAPHSNPSAYAAAPPSASYHPRNPPASVISLAPRFSSETDRPSFTTNTAPGETSIILHSSGTALRMARDVVLNNMANAGTTAFKRSRLHLEDLPYRQITLPGAQDTNGKLAAVGVQVGLGVCAAGTVTKFSQGSLLSTGQQLDLAIVGDGLFQVQDGSEILYTRAGTFTTNADGDIVLTSADKGRLLEPAISIPQDFENIVISGEGIVSVKQAGSSTLTQVGQITTARFVNSNGLIARGENLYAECDASGAALVGNPGQEGRGLLRQSTLEMSNVDPEQELQELQRIQTQLDAISQARAILSSGRSGPPELASETRYWSYAPDPTAQGTHETTPTAPR